MSKHTFSGTVRRELRKRIELANGFTTAPDGVEVGYIELTVDVERLINMLGVKALRSKGGRAQGQCGAIVAKVANRRREGGGQ